jgi:hypothetical protein
MYWVWASQYEEFVRKASQLTAAAGSGSSPLAAVALNKASAYIISITTHYFSGLPNHQYRNNIAGTKKVN